MVSVAAVTTKVVVVGAQDAELSPAAKDLGSEFEWTLLLARYSITTIHGTTVHSPSLPASPVS